MSYIIGFLKKLLGAREFISALLVGLQVAYFIALAAFLVNLVNLLIKIYNYIKEIFGMLGGGNAVLAGSAGGNDFNAVAWSMLNAYGVIEVFNSFLPLIYSTFMIYLVLFATRMLLDFQAKALEAARKAANLMLG